MKFGFVTCVQLGLTCMEAIYEAGGRLDLAVTLKDELAQKKSGRVFLDDFCRKQAIDLVKIRHVNDPECIAAIREKEIDWLFIIGWSQIAGPEALAAPRRGALGIHPTLLPEGRGRAPIPWAILKGLKQTGVTLFKLDTGVDTGEILAQEVLPLVADETATTLYARVNEAHQTIIRNIWPDLTADRLTLRNQDETRATIWEGRKPEDGRITTVMPVEYVERLVRATTHPYPGAFFESESGKRIVIWGGRIGDPSVDPAGGNYRIKLEDGVYDAIDFDARDIQAG
jgi:methionyl-tRNA formyltransferase